jgi:hypothetical protein
MPLGAILKPVERVLSFLAGRGAKRCFDAILGLFTGREVAFKNGGMPRRYQIADGARLTTGKKFDISLTNEGQSHQNFHTVLREHFPTNFRLTFQKPPALN